VKQRVSAVTQGGFKQPTTAVSQFLVDVGWAMEFLTQDQFNVLSNPGVISVQLLSPHNSASNRVTITRVTVEPNAQQPTHQHATSEQVWVAISGSGTLLLDEGKTQAFQAGEVVRFADGDTHGIENRGVEPFVYISVTSPPINFAYAYEEGNLQSI
jgi:mannose-6-phosphate isomerase-like protein (cupin superfamily)